MVAAGNVAVCLRAGNSSGALLRALWHRVSLMEPYPSMHSIGYAPFVTIGQYEGVPIDHLAAFIREQSKTWCIHLHFTRLDLIDGQSITVGAIPDPNRQLIEMHRALNSYIEPRLNHPLLRPGNWAPMSPIGNAVKTNFRGAAKSYIAAPLKPFTVRFDHIDLVRFLPFEEIMMQPLIADQNY
ncbi:MAG: hypothetical protein JKY49_17115 [Cohaesibacteraceae bacterium]|nr:hypothetical protein [Cohaesibacteraceae bacterium]